MFDTNGTIVATPALSLAFDLTHVRISAEGDPSLELFGFGGYARYQTTAKSALALRYEWLDDEGLFGGIDQTLQEVTLTSDTSSRRVSGARGIPARFLGSGVLRRARRGARNASEHRTHRPGVVDGNKTGSW